jgi:hypothetical protein
MGGSSVAKESAMYEQEPRIEDRATRGDVVAAMIAALIGIALVALAVTFLDMREQPSALSALPLAGDRSRLAP